MKTRKNIIQYTGQAGSLMIEAMAMLALISLVTPTLYKKSAERTTELQDINTATHLRTLIKAADNYAADHYNELLEGLNDGEVKKLDVSAENSEFSKYLPYGYNVTENLKNFASPNIVLYRQGNAITSYVELPTKLDVQPMRAARIASMVGSNGGYVNTDQKIDGVGGSWSIEKDDVTGKLKFSGQPNSVVATSVEAVTSASSNALENDKYLQRTKVDSNNQKWRNAMSTDLYMGGLSGQSGASGDVSDMHKILGVDQLILGGVSSGMSNDYDLILEDGGSAYVGGDTDVRGALTALEGRFTVDNDDGLKFGSTDGAGDILTAKSDNINLLNGKAVLSSSTANGNTSTTFDVKADTKVTGTLSSTGNTALATDDGAIFMAGQNGRFISADMSDIKINTDQIQLSTEGTKYKGTIRGNTYFDTTDGYVAVGADNVTSPENYSELAPKFKVTGNAYVEGTLYTDDLKTENFDTLELHAGKENFGDLSWLNATKDGVEVSDNGSSRMEITTGGTVLTGPGGEGSIEMSTEHGRNTVVIDGGEGNNVKLNADNGSVILQDAVKVKAEDDNRYLIVSSDTDVYVRGADSADLFDITHANTVTDYSQVISRADKTIVSTQGGDSYFGIEPSWQDGGSVFFKVAPSLAIDPEKDDNTSQVYVDEDSFRISNSRSRSLTRVLEVDTREDNGASPNDTTNYGSTKGSVYIRKGAIEVMPSPATTTKYAAAEGYGYVSASRFVANNTEATPSYINDTSIGWGNGYGVSATNPDVYMVNPAYTSVMHDIKLTTRGGARLSDILPDFINKGIYVVNNTYSDVGHPDPNYYKKDKQEWKDVETSTEVWASPYLGTVPAPQCPPGYARVMTITPAGFMMGQAGELRNINGGDNRLEVQQAVMNEEFADISTTLETNSTAAEYSWNNVTSSETNTQNGYYLFGGVNDTAYRPTPIYFQQSTWLKSKIVPQDTEHGACNYSGITEAKCTSSAFIGWNAIMGFIYPQAWYGKVIDTLASYANIGDSENTNAESKKDDTLVYWNIFPVRANTLEAYATIYCYFDRTGRYTDNQANIDSKQVDQYDYLSTLGSPSRTKSEDYLERLNDPTLTYDSVW